MKWLLFVFCGALSAAAHAQPPAQTQPPAQNTPVKCQSGSPQGELACLTPDLKEVEIAVERQLYQLGRKLRANERTKDSIAYRELKASQVSWKHYRNQFCNIESLAAVGQRDEWLKVRNTECAMRLTKDRLESLRDLEATLGD